MTDAVPGRKGVLFVVTLWAAITLNFILPRLMRVLRRTPHWESSRRRACRSPTPSGTPSRSSSACPHERVSRSTGLPKNIVQFKFGHSYSFPSETVAHTIGKALPWTLVLVGATTVFAFVVGTLLGVFAGWRRGKASDTSVTLGATFFAAFPRSGSACSCCTSSRTRTAVPDQGWLRRGRHSELEPVVPRDAFKHSVLPR